MSDKLEQQLHAAFAAKLGSVSPTVVARVCTTDYRPKQHRLALIPVLGGGITSIAACAIAVAVFLSSGTTSAFAGWTAQPTPLTAAALAQARDVCGKVPEDNVLASEARGPFVAIVYTRDSSPWECISNGPEVFLNQTTPNPPSAFANPGSGKVTWPVISARRAHGAGQAQLNADRKRGFQLYYQERALQRRNRELTQAQQRTFTSAEQALAKRNRAVTMGPDSLTAVSGAVGTNVTGVVLVLADGKRVVATVRHDWYLAWWPGVTTHNAYPVSIRVTTPTGTATAGFARATLKEEFTGCFLNEKCFLPRIKLRSGVAPELKQYFKLFRNTPPASGVLLRELEPGAWSVGIGADIPQLRAVSLGRRGTVIAIPGTGGVCIEIAQFDTDRSGLGRADRLAASGRADGFGADQGSCTAEAHDPFYPSGRGIFIGSYYRGPASPSGVWSVLGLVPDGNQTITVHLKSGQTAKLRVKENIVFGKFTVRLASVVYKDAAGHRITFRPHY